MKSTQICLYLHLSSLEAFTVCCKLVFCNKLRGKNNTAHEKRTATRWVFDKKEKSGYAD